MTEAVVRREARNHGESLPRAASTPGPDPQRRVELLLAELAEELREGPGVLVDVRRGPLRCLVLRERTAVLSPREMEIARMVAAGHPTKRIAHTLGISGFTVSSHVRRIFVKLDVSSRAAMVARLTSGGCVDLTLADGPAEPVRAQLPSSVT